LKAAPPVSVRAAGGVPWRALLVTLPALAAGVLAAWLAAWAEAAGTTAALAAAAAALGAAALAWRLERPREIELAWDGQRWSADGVAGRLEPVIDLGPWLLLELTPEERGLSRRWIPFSTASAGPMLPALRTAVYSSRAAAAPSPAPPRSGSPGPPPT